MINTQTYYAKLATNMGITEDEIVALLKENDQLKFGIAYLASCQAATVESLPKSTSNSQRQRHQAICQTAAKFLQGDPTALRSGPSVENALKRCLEAVQLTEG